VITEKTDRTAQINAMLFPLGDFKPYRLLSDFQQQENHFENVA